MLFVFTCVYIVCCQTRFIYQSMFMLFISNMMGVTSGAELLNIRYNPVSTPFLWVFGVAQSLTCCVVSGGFFLLFVPLSFRLLRLSLGISIF